FLENPVQSKNTAVLIGIVLISMVAFCMVTFRRAYVQRKRDNQVDGTFVPLGNYSFYAERRLLKNGKATIALTDKESKLLSVLAANQNQPMERDQLLKEVWEDDGVFVGRSLDVFISKLRKELLHDAAIRIVNIHGKGYKLEVD